MKKVIYYFLLTGLVVKLNSSVVTAQVGINTDDPHPSSILQVYSTNRGVLFPGLSRGDIISNPAEGLLIFNTTTKMFDYYNKTWLKWQPISPLVIDSAGYAMNSNLKFNSPVTMNSRLFMKDTLSELKGYGSIPLGGIIMWSGTNIPNGWALCDGHTTTEGVITPDLRGRFIVGYGSSSLGMGDVTAWDPNYSSPGNLSSKGSVKGKTGGFKVICITSDQLPSHNHLINLATSFAGEHIHPYITAETDGNFSPYLRAGSKGAIMNHVGGYYVSYDTITHQTKQIDLPRAITGNQMDPVPNHAHLVKGNTEITGSGNAIENRPPYYVLAFIMRVK